jgi:nitrous oxidase accessory protein
MNKSFIVISISILLIAVNVSSLPNSSLIFNNSAFKESGYIFVNNSNIDGPWDGSEDNPFYFIQDAIEISSPYDVIIVEYGIYFESIHIDKSLELIGINYPVVDGGYKESVIHVYVNDVGINGFIICNSGGFPQNAGIQLIDVKNISLNDCVLYNLKTGIRQINSEEILINNCSFLHNANGISIENNGLININQCYFSKNAISIVGNNTENVLIKSSSFVCNGISGYFQKSSDIIIEFCNISDNSVNKGGFFFNEVSNVKINQSLFNHNGDSISLSDSINVTIINSTFTNNTHFAISMRKPSYNVLINQCIISNNLRTAIYIEKENECIISNCNIENNYLYSINIINAVCYLTYNWWGSDLGPYSPEFLITNKLTNFRSKITSYPWEKNILENIGVNQDFLSQIPDHPEIKNEKFFNFSGKDTDGDIAPDWWEEKWGYSIINMDEHANLDPDFDGLNNLEECYTDEYGSNPFYKDIFLELDWMKCPETDANKPSQEQITRIIQEFEDHDISLHIDIGNMGGGEEIPGFCNQTMRYQELQDIYWQYFLENNITNLRKGIFHYGVICNYCPDLNFPFTGWDSLDSFAISVQWMNEQYRYLKRSRIISGGIMHHLGHTLGLIADKHMGIDNVDTLKPFSYNWFKYLGYVSSMNYFYKFKILKYSDGENGLNDYNDWENIDFNFFKNSSYKI